MLSFSSISYDILILYRIHQHCRMWIRRFITKVSRFLQYLLRLTGFGFPAEMFNSRLTLRILCMSADHFLEAGSSITLSDRDKHDAVFK
jgi:hypothetical protein